MPLSSVLGAQSLVRPGVCTSSTRPASPFEGQVIYETDTDKILAYDGSVWQEYRKATAGQVLQVVSTAKTDTFSHSTNVFTDVTGLSVSITPASSSNKVLVSFTCHVSTSSSTSGSLKLVRGSTDIFIGDAAGSRVRVSQTAYNSFGETLSGFFLDSPASTSSVTYKLQARANDNAAAVYVNRTSVDTDSAVYTRGASSITVMEISG